MTRLPRLRDLLIAAPLATILVASTHASAQRPESSSADRTRARRLFEEAAELESKREWGAATEKLQEALGIVETPGLRYHLAYCQEEQGLMVEALANYERAQQMIAGGSKAPDVAELLAPKRDALLTRIPKLKVRARAPAVLERVAIDGMLVAPGQLIEPIALNPGRRRVTVWAKGQKSPLEREIELVESREAAEEFVWPSSPAASPATPIATPPLAPDRRDAADPTEPRSSGMPARTVVLIAEVSVTAVALGVGIGFLASANSAGNDADEVGARLRSSDCAPAPRPAQVVADCAAFHEANHRRDNHQTIAAAALITAGVGAVATVTTWLLWKPAPDRAALGVNVTPTANGGVLELRGRF